MEHKDGSGNDKKDKKNENGTGLALGLCLGLVFGMLFDQLAIGLSLGLVFGLSYDAYVEKKAKDGEQGKDG